VNFVLCLDALTKKESRPQDGIRPPFLWSSNLYTNLHTDSYNKYLSVTIPVPNGLKQVNVYHYAFVFFLLKISVIFKKIKKKEFWK